MTIGKSLPGLWMLCAVATVASVLAFSADAQDTASSDGYRLRVVNVQKVMDNYDKHASKVAEMQQATEEKQAEFEEREERLKADLEAFEQEREGMTPTEREERLSELSRRDTMLRTDVNESSERYKRRWSLIRKELLEDIVMAIEQVGVANDYHLILHFDDQRTTSVLYYSTPLDITQRVIERVNANYSAQDNS